MVANLSSYSLSVCYLSCPVLSECGVTGERDTCAAHAIVNEAGGRVVQAAGGAPCEEGEALRYNKEDQLNPFFVVYGNQTD
mmetsp:Transcript_29532/g.73545  ORF Transcript_29532/g.73545 Transcript_29532/m.73545 type:complete len:81 (-) Transcript_29532:2368-2610(-)